MYFKIVKQNNIKVEVLGRDLINFFFVAFAGGGRGSLLNPIIYLPHTSLLSQQEYSNPTLKISPRGHKVSPHISRI
jgi:hypothetical protein